jgi:hypothetical protein
MMGSAAVVVVRAMAVVLLLVCDVDDVSVVSAMVTGVG